MGIGVASRKRNRDNELVRLLHLGKLKTEGIKLGYLSVCDVGKSLRIPEDHLIFGIYPYGEGCLGKSFAVV